MQRAFVAVAIVAAVATSVWLSVPVRGQAAPGGHDAPGWEYKVILMKNLTDIDVNRIQVFNTSKEQEAEITSKVQSSLNEFGKEGWELCQELNGGLIFKRPR